MRIVFILTNDNPAIIMADKSETALHCGRTERKVCTMAKQKRMLALVMAAAILFIVLTSAFFIAAEATHDCIGGGCKICCQINVCCTVLKALALAVIAAVLAVVAGYAFGFGVADKYVFCPRFTLVSLKVKLSD